MTDAHIHRGVKSRVSCNTISGLLMSVPYEWDEVLTLKVLVAYMLFQEIDQLFTSVSMYDISSVNFIPYHSIKEEHVTTASHDN